MSVRPRNATIYPTGDEETIPSTQRATKVRK
ncbi:hypothetical protein GBAR_LOCUS23219 [Geodia barretti]|uniref:Uncharacterized protein n=1 Tax=Geodia barretti TaxID=519541 RepID=A0AA35T4V4_GEOBA|nr:hypothetical protein GBAR_LOCUS23219 [Geodia barretti]